MIDPHSSGLFTDLYELTMAASYVRHRMFAPATFSLFVRSLPQQRGFLVAAGIDEVLQLLEEFAFSKEDIEFLHSTKRFSADVLDYLANLRFTGDVYALPEGSLCFAQEPLIEVTGPIIEAQLIETVVLNALHIQTLIVSKAVRSVVAAQGRGVIDFSLRRTHGSDAGLKVARASYLAGFDGTSNVLAGRLYDIPLYGTMAHSFIESFDNEEAAFQAYADTFPDDTALLIDTYDTVRGAQRAARVGQRLLQHGHWLRGVRLDSGDLLSLSHETRKILNDAGLDFVRIYASGGLDETHVDRLVQAGAPIDVFGVGTAMGVSNDAPSLDMAYKLVEYDGRPRLKLSSGKVSLVGKKQIFRILGTDGHFERDVIGLREEAVEAVAHEVGVTVEQVVPLLQPMMSQGRRLQPPVSLSDSRTRCTEDLKRLSPDVRGFSPTLPYPVTLTQALTTFQEEAIARVRAHDAGA